MDMIKAFVIFVLSVATLNQLTAQSSKQEAARGSDFYADSMYTESIENYEKSLKIEANPEYQFNLGNAYLKSGDLDNAKKAFEEVLNSNSAGEDIKSKSAYNLGNLSYTEQDYEDAIKKYKESLTLNPEDVLASENLQIARSRMIQQQQQEQQQQQQQQQEQSQEQQEQQQQEGNPEDNEQEASQPNEPEENEQPEEQQPNQSEENENSEDEKEESKSEKVTMDRADELMDYLDKLESETKERLNGDVLEEKKKGSNKKIIKDW